MYVLDGSLTGVKYRDDILQNNIFPHFDNHNLASRPIFIDDSDRLRRAKIV